MQKPPRSIPGSGKSTGEGIGYPLQHFWASLVAQLVKNPLAMSHKESDMTEQLSLSVFIVMIQYFCVLCYIFSLVSQRYN